MAAAVTRKLQLDEVFNQTFYRTAKFRLSDARRGMSDHSDLQYQYGEECARFATVLLSDRYKKTGRTRPRTVHPSPARVTCSILIGQLFAETEFQCQSSEVAPAHMAQDLNAESIREEQEAGTRAEVNVLRHHVVTLATSIASRRVILENGPWVLSRLGIQRVINEWLSPLEDVKPG